MSRKRKVVLVVIAVASSLIAALLAIIASIATAYLPSSAESWVKEHISWFWVATGILLLLAMILVAITTYIQFTDAGSSSYSNKDLDDITNKVNRAADIANEDPMLMKHSNRFQMLSNWKQYVQTLEQTYKNYKVRRDRVSKHATNQIVDLIVKLVKHTKRSFIFLNRKDDFAKIATLTYNIAFDQKRWDYAAELAYEVGRVYHELGEHANSNDWIEPLRTCSKNANFDGYWIKCYNGMDTDQPGALDEPHQPEAKESFLEALAYAAKLYDLEGLNNQDDNEAEKYFKKALTRATKLPNQMLHSWVEIHLAEVALRLGLKPATHFTDALDPFKTLNLDTLDPPKRSDVVNLMLTCYYQLGRSDEPIQNKGSNAGVPWYQLQLDLAEKYGSSHFQVLAHERLASISLLEGLTQTSSSEQSKSFQNAYEHAKQAWEINKSFGDEGPGVIEPNVLVELIINITDRLTKLANVHLAP